MSQDIVYWLTPRGWNDFGPAKTNCLRHCAGEGRADPALWPMTQGDSANPWNLVVKHLEENVAATSLELLHTATISCLR